MDILDAIKAKIEKEIAPYDLEVLDVSYLHKGHKAWRKNIPTHLKINIMDDGLYGLPRLERERKIYACLADELRCMIHSISIDIKPLPKTIAPPNLK